MTGRKSMRTRRRSHHIAAETIEEPLDDMLKASKPQTKRQRRLTAHQRATNAQVDGLKQQLQAPKPAAVPAPKNVVDVLLEPKVEPNPAPPAARQILNHSSSSSDSEEEDEEPSYHNPGYISSGSSRKMAPGKRIKWRAAISDGDIIRKDLSLAFLFASM
ncbi:hypothetical protein Ndes2526B_g05667 [Nannochloris sp. 'desiccata']|nr:hypothetical protein NADE_005594 [Chlorella desiccata (nom. nud.)]